MKTPLFAAFVLLFIIVFTTSGSIAGQKKTDDPKGSISLPNGNLRFNAQHPVGEKVTNVIKQAGTKFDPRRYDRQIKTLKKIANQRTLARSLQKSIQKSQRERDMKHTAALQQGKKVRLFGKPTRFIQAPSATRSPLGIRAAHPMASNVQINGKSQDTIFVGDPFTLTFSFAPGYISALLNVYVDADSNGVVSDADIQIGGNMLMMDNDDNDLNLSDGEYQVQLNGNDIANEIVSSLIFEVDDYQSVSTAMLTVRQRPASSIVLATINPPMPYIACIVSTNTENVILFSDSLGKFSLSVDRQSAGIASLRLFDIAGVTNAYTPPPGQSIKIISDTTTVDFNYSPATTFIEGYAKDQTGAAVNNVQVEAGGNSLDVIAKTDSTGFYKVGVVPGTWYLYPEGTGTADYLQYYNSVGPIIVSSNSTVQKNLLFTKANSSISGTIVLNGKGLGGITIQASTDSLYNNVISSANGTYSIPVYKPPTGTELYNVTAQINTNGLGYYVATPSQAGVVPGASNVNFEIKKTLGGLQGKIIDSKTGTPIAGAYISISGPYYQSATSNDTGFYRVSLPDGNYYLTIQATPYYSYSEQNIIIAGAMVTKNVAMLRSGSFSGSVKDQQGNPIFNAEVIAIDSAGFSIGYASPDQQGNYTLGELTTQKYRAYANANGYMQQWYHNASVEDSATFISVTDGYDTPNINFVLSRGGSISGKVVDKLGHPITDIQIEVLDTSYNYRAYSTTNDSGYYQATGLGTGKYYVWASNPLYYDQWYNGATSQANATTVSVVINQDTPNINFTLILGSSISGLVKDKNNAGISYAEIAVLDSSFNTIGNVSADEAGNYILSRLAPAKKMLIMAQEYGYGTRWYNNVSTPDSATPLVLQPGEQRTGIDFTLPLAGSISGMVHDDAGLTIPSAEIYVHDSTGNYISSGSADGEGNYTVSNLNSGNYYVMALEYNYDNQWFDHKSSLQSANKVIVVEEHVTPNINFNLHRIITSDSVVVKIQLANLPDSLTFSQSYVSDYAYDYLWGIFFDVDANANTGQNGFEVELALLHYKSPGDPVFKSTIIDGTYHALLVWDNANTPLWNHDDVSARIDPLNKNTLILTAPKWWPELSAISSTTRFYAYTYYMAENEVYSDVTSIANGGSVTDPSSDVPYGFIDILSASWSEVVTAVRVVNSVPVTFALQQNYPNPFNPSTTIAFDLPSQSFVSLKVYNILGQEVANLVDEVRPAGRYHERWNAQNVASGIYFYNIRAGEFTQTRKMILLK